MYEKPLSPPSPWVVRWAQTLAPGSTILDLACGGGRHARWALNQGFRVAVLDNDVAGVSDLAGRTEIIEADLEDGSPWPLTDRVFDAVIVVNYLHRSLWPTLLNAIAPGGLLIYETFMQGNEAYGRPRRPDFLLEPGELKTVVGDRFKILGFEDGPEGNPITAVKQKICARKI